ncbi:hypothetical protein GIB67_003875 [Kingdonia uniflora]|uniref:Transposase MuDR plant domain-containing protein n=1 Tax=Kingdonia uniflora TaxID=39325 RepID=A0A7J7LK29_9MAGN|nr:hypothetical protein GIB67_003875 [Kingdonia uniflora]
MNGVQVYTIVHFGGDIVRPKIGSIVSYVGGSTKLTSLRAHSSDEDFITLLEKISEIHREDSELRFDSQPEQMKDLVDFWFKSTAYTEDPYDFSKEFNIGDLYRDRIKLKNHIRAYVVVNKFNLEHVLSNEHKIVVRCKGYKCFWRIYATRCDALSTYTNYLRATLRKYGVTYTNYVESWNNVILKVRDLPIHVFIEDLRRICLKMSFMYREEAEKSQTRLTPWDTDHCESRKFMADSLTCGVRTSRYHFQITSYGRTDSVNIKDCICSCRWR